MTRTQKRYAGSATRYAVLTLWALIVAFPLYWMITTSFKPSDQWFSWPPVYFPSPPTIENYRDVWLGNTAGVSGGQMANEMQTPFLALRNSIILSFGATTLAVLYGAVIAYGVSRYRLLSETRMFQLLMLRMVPPIVIVAPLSLYYSYIGLLDSLVGLGMLYFLSSLPYAVWMTKSFIDEVPREVEQAAEILGASSWRIFWEVQLPLLRPVIMLALILRFLDAMGSFPMIWALLQGGPGTATETLPVYIYITTWQDFNVSLGAAQSYIVMIMMVVIVLIAIRLLRKEKRSLDTIYAKPGEAGPA